MDTIHTKDGYYAYQGWILSILSTDTMRTKDEYYRSISDTLKREYQDAILELKHPWRLTIARLCRSNRRDLLQPKERLRRRMLKGGAAPNF